ncbi:MAG TPA: hypothetical protein VL422_03030 [Miltoncostaea sp.]|nr:hypothetical protein [Miltoncostaea sp.]
MADPMHLVAAMPELDGWIALPCVSWVLLAGIDDRATALPLPVQAEVVVTPAAQP